MWWNPFYDTKINNDGILIINKFTNQQKFQIKTTNAKVFIETILKPLIYEKADVEEFLMQFSGQVKSNLQNLMRQLEKVILLNKKQHDFYKHLFEIVERIRREFPGLYIDKIVNYMEDMILCADSIVLFDNQFYSGQEICSILPFKHIDIINVKGTIKEIIQQKIANLKEKDWIIFLINDLDSDIVDVIERDIMENNRIIFFSENNILENKVTFGPILIPRCTGGLKQILQKKYLEKTIPFHGNIANSDEEDIKKIMLSEYMYDEILKFTIDKYSNYATEYSKLLGTQYQIDYEEKNIKRREFIINNDWL